MIDYPGYKQHSGYYQHAREWKNWPGYNTYFQIWRQINTGLDDPERYISGYNYQYGWKTARFYLGPIVGNPEINGLNFHRYLGPKVGNPEINPLNFHPVFSTYLGFIESPFDTEYWVDEGTRSRSRALPSTVVTGYKPLIQVKRSGKWHSFNKTPY